MAESDTLLFWIVFLIIFFINLFAPLVSAGLGETMSSYDTDIIEDSPPSVTAIVTFTGLNILLVPFWTLSVNVWTNLIIMIPLRVLAWYLALRLIRGV